MRNTGLNLYVYDFSIDYDANTVADILDIHKYLIKKVGWYEMFGFVKQVFVSAMIILVLMY